MTPVRPDASSANRQRTVAVASTIALIRPRARPRRCRIARREPAHRRQLGARVRRREPAGGDRTPAGRPDSRCIAGRAERLDVPIARAPPDRVAGRSQEAGGLDRFEHADRRQQLARAGRNRFGGAARGVGRSRQDQHRVSPRARADGRWPIRRDRRRLRRHRRRLTSAHSFRAVKRPVVLPRRSPRPQRKILVFSAIFAFSAVKQQVFGQRVISSAVIRHRLHARRARQIVPVVPAARGTVPVPRCARRRAR